MSEDDFGIYHEFPILIEHLKSNDQLPALVFMNNRNGTEKLAYNLMQHVEKKVKNSSKIKALREKHNSLSENVRRLSRKTNTKAKDEKDNTVRVSEENFDLIKEYEQEIYIETQKLAFSSKKAIPEKIKEKIFCSIMFCTILLYLYL